MLQSFGGNNGKTPADLRGSTERLCKCTSYHFSKGLYVFNFILITKQKPKIFLISTRRNKASNQSVEGKHYFMPNQFVIAFPKDFFFCKKRLLMKMSQLFSTGFCFRYPTWTFCYFVLAFTLMPCNCVSLPLIKLTSNLNSYHLTH